eukprot:gnl/TRDRNA2_/TRDRNA2_88333_c0_seq1.p2 gnl/TRDRNA2_/TRDRNA2_88333_c0~~gnl/TRDRNA2_/TRDRNA2_88333_c0_seq1.p2  ORF type:complete len:147 (+),score=29.09 gnl/TRDRNA2_/TRDRNA2_88333_c0_seq1:390-830(+)
MQVLSYFVAARSGTDSEKFEHFVRELADEVCTEWRQREAIPWTAWRSLVSAAADARVAHRRLFETAAPHLAGNVRLMNGRDAVDVCAAYAAFAYRHNALLSEVSRFLPSMGLDDAEVKALQASLERLEFDAPPLRRLAELHSFSGT